MDLYPDLGREAVKKLGDRARLVGVGGWWVTATAATAGATASSAVASVAVTLIGM